MSNPYFVFPDADQHLATVDDLQMKYGTRMTFQMTDQLRRGPRIRIPQANLSAQSAGDDHVQPAAVVEGLQTTVDDVVKMMLAVRHFDEVSNEQCRGRIVATGHPHTSRVVETHLQRSAVNGITRKSWRRARMLLHVIETGLTTYFNVPSFAGIIHRDLVHHTVMIVEVFRTSSKTIEP